MNLFPSGARSNWFNQKLICQFPKLSQQHISNLAKKHELIPNSEEIITTIQTLLSQLTQNDVYNIGSVVVANAFTDYVTNQHLHLCHQLSQNHEIKCVSDKMPCFWSTREGREQAFLNQDTFTDYDCPVINLIFGICSKLNKIALKIDFDFQILTELSFGISRIYASFAKLVCMKKPQSVIVFLGTDKPTEEIGLHIGNNFWCAELPTLQDLLNLELIQNIIFKIVKNQKIVGQISKKYDKLELPLYRRSWHPLDDDVTKISYVWPKMLQSDWDKWRCAPPRPYITYHNLLEIIKKWRYYKK